MPDYLRLIALFGIVVVNVQFIAFSSLSGFAQPAGDTALDAVTLCLVNGLARALAAGESSLSIYLGQSIILMTVFSGYGFGLWIAMAENG